METQNQTIPENQPKAESFFLKYKISIVVFSVVLILLLGGAAYFFNYHNQNDEENKVSNTPTVTSSLTQTPTVTTTASSTPITTVPVSTLPTGTVTTSNGIQTYTGRGITFHVVQTMDGAPVTIKDFGNRTFVYTGNFSQYNSFVEVFNKVPTDTISQAITKSVLSNYKSSDCPITIGKADSKQPASEESAVIKFSADNIREDGSGKDPSKCPADYTRTSSPMYFVVDSNHPDKLLFLSVGNGGYPANGTQNSLTWFEGLKVTN
jgi:hypothetical protein